MRLRIVVLVLCSCVPRLAAAADVEWRAPPSCQRLDAVEAQAGELVGRPIDEVEELDFVVEVTEQPTGFSVRLDSFVRGEPRGTRVLTGANCAEAADAVAVAIAMAAAEATAAEQPEADVSDTSSQPANDEANAVAATKAARVAEPGGGRTMPPTADSSVPWNLRAGAALVGDVGLSPSLAPGAELSLQASLGRLGLRGYGALFAPTEARLDGRAGAGSIGLQLAGLGVCGEVSLEQSTLAGCAGAEAAHVTGDGREVDQSYHRSAWLAALRAELGLGLPVAGPVSLWLRGGVAVPLGRPSFVIDGEALVHRVGSVAGRAGLGLEVELPL